MVFEDSFRYPARSRQEAEANMRLVAQLSYMARILEQAELNPDNFFGISQVGWRFSTIKTLKDCGRYLTREEMQKLKNNAESDLELELSDIFQL